MTRLNGKNTQIKNTLTTSFALWLASIFLMPAYAAGEIVGSDGAFTAVGNSGQAAWTMSLDVPSGINGVQPDLQLSVASNGRNGVVGVGGNLSGQSAISRCGRTAYQDGFSQAPKYVQNDAYCLDGARLVLESGIYGANGSIYRTEVESFQRIKAHSSIAGKGPAYFEVINRSGVTLIYGQSNGSAEIDPASGAVAVWKIDSLADTNNNTLHYHYENIADSGGQVQNELVKITYGGNACQGVSEHLSVQMVYEDRTDTASTWSRGQKYYLTKRLSNIQTFVGSSLVRDYIITYEQGAVTGASRISKVQECAGNGDCYRASQLKYTPEVDTPWVASNITLPDNLQSSDGKPLGELIDINNDGKMDWVRASVSINGVPTIKTYLGSLSGWQESSEFQLPAALYDYSQNVDGFQLGNLVDVNGDGWVDYVQAHSTQTETVRKTWRNTGSRFELDSSLALPVALSSFENGDMESRANIIDINADGLIDVIQSHKLANGQLLHNTWVQHWDEDSNAHTWEVNSDYKTPTISLDYALGDNGRILALLQDVNGDGLSDWVESYLASGTLNQRTWINTGQAWELSGTYQLPVPIANYDIGSDGVAEYTITDVNGDGLPDIVKAIESDGVLNTDSWINTGQGWLQDNSYRLPSALSRINNDGDVVTIGSMADVNNDGHPDLVHSYIEGNTSTEVVWYRAPASNSWDEVIDSISPFINLEILDDGTSVSYVQIADLDHNGSDEIFIAAEGIQVSVFTSDNGSEKFAGTLEKVINPLGAITLLSYGLSTDSSLYELSPISPYPNIAYNAPTMLVTTISTSNGVGGFTQVHHRYGKGKSNLQGQGGLGFNYHIVEDGNTQSQLETRFSQNYPFTGRVIASYQSANGITYTSTSSQYELKAISINGLNTVYPYISYSANTSHDLNGNLIRTTETNSQVDNYGNVIFTQQQVKKGSAKLLQRTSINRVEYDNDTTQWMLGLATKKTQELVDEVNNKTFTNIATASYEGRRVSFEILEPNNDQKVRKDYGYDGFGYRISTTTSAQGVDPRTTTAKYSQDGRFPVWVKNALDQKVQTDYNPILSKPDIVVDANLIVKEFLYDGFGTTIRETKSHQSSDSMRGREVVMPRWCAEYVGSNCPTNAIYFIAAFDDEGEAPEISYYDINGKELRRQTYGHEGKVVVVETEYDENGRVASVTQPYFEDSETPVVTEFKYDVLGRQIERKVAGTESYNFYTDYNGLINNRLEVVTRNPGNDQSGVQTTKIYNNIFGQPLESIDADNNSTHFEYDIRGKLVKTIDAKNNSSTITYDPVFARKTAMNDPDLGAWTYTYNAFGNLTSQEDANGHITTMEYDLLNRIVRRVDGFGTLQEQVSEWEYDGEDEGDIVGGLKRVTSPSYERTTEYDKYSRPVKATTTITDNTIDHSFTQRNGFLGLTDKVDWVEYPSGLTVRSTYDEYGFPKTVEGISLDITKYTEFQSASKELNRRQRVLEDWEFDKLSDAKHAELEEHEREVRRLGQLLNDFYDEFDDNIQKQGYEDTAQRYTELVERIEQKLTQHRNWFNIYQGEINTRYNKIKVDVERLDQLVELSAPHERAFDDAVYYHDKYAEQADHYAEKINKQADVINANVDIAEQEKINISNLIHELYKEPTATHYATAADGLEAMWNDLDCCGQYVVETFMKSQDINFIEPRLIRISQHTDAYNNAVTVANAAQKIIDDNEWEWWYNHWEPRRKAEEDKMEAAAAKINQYAAEANTRNARIKPDVDRINDWLSPIAQSHNNIIMSFNDRARAYVAEISKQTGSYAKREDLKSENFLKPFANHINYAKCLRDQSAKSMGDCYAETLVHVYNDDGTVDTVKQDAARAKVDDNARIDIKQFWSTRRFFCSVYRGYSCPSKFDPEIRELTKALHIRQCARMTAKQKEDSNLTCTTSKWDETYVHSNGQTYNKYPYLISSIADVSQNVSTVFAYNLKLAIKHTAEVERLVTNATKNTYNAETSYNEIVNGIVWEPNPNQSDEDVKPQSREMECTQWSSFGGGVICTARAERDTTDDPEVDPDDYVLLYKGELQKLVYNTMSADQRVAYRELKGHQQAIQDIVIEAEATAYEELYLAVQNQLELVNRLYEEINRDYANAEYIDEYEAAKKVYWEAKDINAEGQIKYAKYGNDVETEWTYDQFGRMVGHYSINKNQAAIANNTYESVIVSNTYEYDAIGNLLNRKDVIEDVTEDYAYDSMNRLVQVSFGGTGSAAVSKVGLSTVEYRYDELGNITQKSDIAGCISETCYQYGNADNPNNPGPHAVISIDGISGNFTYDNNGNQLTGNGRTIEYSAFNKPVSINKNGKNTHLLYGPERQIIKQLEQTDQGHETTLYVGGLYEKISKGAGAAIQRHNITVAGRVIAVVDTAESSIIPTKEHYLHKNHQGSVIAVSDHTGEIVERRFYDAFGDIRSDLGQAAAYTVGLSFNAVTNLSFTGHRFLRSANIIHMGGRVYDPLIGRFLSADPFIQSPLNSQSFNRYSYVLNNPLSLTDPSGYLFSHLKKKLKKLFSKIKRVISRVLKHIKKTLKSIARGLKKIQRWAVRQVIRSNEIARKLPLGGIIESVDNYVAESSWAQAIIIVVATAYGGAYGAAAANAYITYVSGGSVDNIRRAGRTAAVTHIFSTYFKIGSFIKGIPELAQQAISAGFNNAVISRINGGSFSKNFWRGVVSFVAFQAAVEVGRWIVVKIQQGIQWVRDNFGRRAQPAPPPVPSFTTSFGDSSVTAACADVGTCDRGISYIEDLGGPPHPTLGGNGYVGGGDGSGLGNGNGSGLGNGGLTFNVGTNFDLTSTGARGYGGKVTIGTYVNLTVSGDGVHLNEAFGAYGFSPQVGIDSLDAGIGLSIVPGSSGNVAGPSINASFDGSIIYGDVLFHPLTADFNGATVGISTPGSGFSLGLGYTRIIPFWLH